MRIRFIDANGHTTLWDKNYFVDNSNYLDNNNLIVTEAYFWELVGAVQ